jgi:antibiotic biosynthesis monooxygenase (ABM) superfamily enzyme
MEETGTLRALHDDQTFRWMSNMGVTLMVMSPVSNGNSLTLKPKLEGLSKFNTMMIRIANTFHQCNSTATSMPTPVAV